MYGWVGALQFEFNQADTVTAADNALSRAPNAGACKNVINLNGFWALVLSTLFMNGKFTPKLGLGSALVLLGAYLYTD